MDIDSSLLIQRGAILKGEIFPNIDHPKYFVIMGEDDHHLLGFFFINSNVHRSLLDKQLQLDLQYPLLKTHYDFLHHNSFVCASSLIKLSKDTIAQGLNSGEVCFIDTLRNEDLELIRQAVQASPLFSTIDKQRFFS